ncbi:MAG: hypothetical protein ACI4BH_07585 [Muribaculaceae bacterium]
MEIRVLTNRRAGRHATCCGKSAKSVVDYHLLGKKIRSCGGYNRKKLVILQFGNCAPGQNAYNQRLATAAKMQKIEKIIINETK